MIGVVDMKTNKVHKLTIAALLVAVGILIPMIFTGQISLRASFFHIS